LGNDIDIIGIWKIGSGERSGPIAIDTGADNPIVCKFALRFTLPNEVQAALHQVKVPEKTLLNQSRLIVSPIRVSYSTSNSNTIDKTKR
jgi:hypothetical protein